MTIEIPGEFVDLSVIFCDENRELSLDDDEALARTIELLQYEDRLRTVRDFFENVLESADEGTLRLIWEQTSPQVAFSGENVYRNFFVLARNLLTEALEDGRFEMRKS